MFSKKYIQQPKKCSGNQCSHNLNIQMYTFREILALFDLENQTTITETDMRNSKMIVLRMHPDKSRLSPNYFIFYKKAYEILYEFYKNQTKVESNAPTTEVNYDPYHIEGVSNNLNKASNEKVKTMLGEMKAKDFQTQFHQLYEENMVDKDAKQRAQDRNRWFTQEDAQYSIDTKGLNKDTIHQKIGDLRRDSTAMYLDKYRGVQTLSNLGGGSIQSGNLWDNDQEMEEAMSNTYITTDPFSKLKFDDLRRVHKDQTVFVVDEGQYDQMPKYTSMDQYARARDSVDLTPMKNTEAERVLREQEDMLKARQAKYQQDAILRTKYYEEKNKNVMAQFLRLT